MKVYFYSGMQKLIEKSGVGRAIYHQRFAARENRMEVIDQLEGADVVHINTVFPKSYFLAKKARQKHIPVIYHAHSTKEDFKNSYLGSNLFDGLFGKWIQLCYNTGDMIVTPTNYSKCLLKSYGIKKRIEVVSNGIDLNYYDRNNVKRETFRRKYGYGEKEKIIMSVGLTIDRKGVEDFVKLAKRMPEYQFIWFGETNLYTVPQKIKRVVQTKLDNLQFAGYAKKEDLREAYGSCDLFLFPSKEETEGIVVLEALAMKIPVLLRDIPVYRDWLQTNVEVYKADNVEGFEKRAKQILEKEIPSLVEEGHKAVEAKNILKVGEQLRNIYEKAILTYEPEKGLETI